MTSPTCAFSVFLLMTFALPAGGQSLGYYHLPSTLPQFCGLGCGAGHHVPMIRPTHCHVPRVPRHIRMPGCAACGAMPMEAFPTCYSPDCHAELDRLLKYGDHDNSPELPAVPTPIDVSPTQESIEIEGAGPLPQP